MCRAVLRSRLKLPSINNKKVQRSLDLLGLCIARSSAVSKFSRYSSYCPVPLDGASKDSLPPGWKYSVFGCAAAGGHSSNLFHSLVPTSNTIAFGMGGGSALSGEGVLRCLHGESPEQEESTTTQPVPCAIVIKMSFMVCKRYATHAAWSEPGCCS